MGVTRPQYLQRLRQASELVFQGCANKEIGARLGISEQMARHYVSCAGIHSRREAMAQRIADLEQQVRDLTAVAAGSD